MATYAYCRVSTKSQSIARQTANIKAVFPDIPTANFYSDKYTGTTMNRPEWDRLMKKVQNGDTIVFDSVSRMSRCADEGMSVYAELYNNGVSLVFLNEPECNTSVLNDTKGQIPMTGTDADIILKAVNKYLLKMVQNQIRIIFERAEAEVNDLHKRTSDGMKAALIEKKKTDSTAHYGRDIGKAYETKKSVECKGRIKELSKDFNGQLDDGDVMKILDIARNSYYKYKKEIREAHE